MTAGALAAGLYLDALGLLDRRRAPDSDLQNAVLEAGVDRTLVTPWGDHRLLRNEPERRPLHSARPVGDTSDHLVEETVHLAQRVVETCPL